MIRLFKHYIPHAAMVLACVDVVILFVAGEVAWQIRAAQIDPPIGSIAERVGPTLAFVLAVEAALIALGAYRSESLRSSRYATARIFIAVGLGLVLLSLLDLLVRGDILPPFVLLYAATLAIFLLPINRAITGPILGTSKSQRKILILGAGKRAQRLYELSLLRGSSFAITAFVNMGDGPAVVEKAMPRTSIADLGSFVERRKVSEVVLALEERRNISPLKDLQQIRTRGIGICGFSNFLERETGRLDLDTLDPSQLVFSDSHSGGQVLSAAFKRAFDVLISGSVLALTWPLLILFAILIKLESKGPVLVRQTRIGLYGEPFEAITLRSAKQEQAQDEAEPTEKNSPRATRIGKFIRMVRIDGLPQLWNVLRGNMSIVGPRAERPETVAALVRKLPLYQVRHMVKPGMTGWARINLAHGASLGNSRRELEYDLFYVKNRSVFLDVLTLIQAAHTTLSPGDGR